MLEPNEVVHDDDVIFYLIDDRNNAPGIESVFIASSLAVQKLYAALCSATTTAKRRQEEGRPERQ